MLDGKDRLFYDNSDADIGPKWIELQTRLNRGDWVSGKVVNRQPYGVFVDIGVGFPALLEVVRFIDGRNRRYTFEEYPAVGETLTARVVGFRNSEREVGLTQLNPHPYLDTELPGDR